MDRRKQMRALLARREREGLTFRELSHAAGIPAGTLAFWAWKLRSEAALEPPSSVSPGDRFVEFVLGPGTATEPVTSRLEIQLGRDRRVLVTGPVDAEQLARVVQVLERC